MPDTADMNRAFNVIREAVAEEFADIGDSMINDMRDMLSVDVEREGGVVTVRSVSPESPRRESGALWESINKAIEDALYGVELVTFTDKNYSAILESTAFRTGARPHWSHLYQTWTGMVPQRLAHKIQQL